MKHLNLDSVLFNNQKGPFTLRVSVNVTATLLLKNRAGFDFASVLGETLSVHMHILLPMDDTGDITLDHCYADTDFWCEWAQRKTKL